MKPPGIHCGFPTTNLARAPRPRFRRFRAPCALLIALAAPRGLALNPDGKPADYIVKHWDTEDGLPHNAIEQLFQSSDGYHGPREFRIGRGYAARRSSHASR